MKSALLSFLLLFAPALAQAQDAPVLNIRNAGAQACSKLQQTYGNAGNELDKTAYLQWVGGYVTGVARTNNIVDVFPLQNTLQLMQMLVLVCVEKPDQPVENALLTTLLRLRPFWVKRNPEVLTITRGENTALLYAEAVAPLQQALKDRGFDPGAVDGAFGVSTATAIGAVMTAAQAGATQLPNGVFFYVLTRP